MKNRNLTLASILAAVALLIAGPSHADLSLQINDGSVTTIVDNGVGDSAAGIDGVITNIDNYNNFVVLISTARGTEINTRPNIFDLSVDGNSTGAGSITVGMSETGLTDIGGLVEMVVTGTLSAGGSMTWALYVDASNTAHNEATLVASSGTLTGSVANTYNGIIDVDEPFSATLVVTLTADRGGVSFSSDTGVNVPEPSVVMLIGVGLLGMGIVASRRRKS